MFGESTTDDEEAPSLTDVVEELAAIREQLEEDEEEDELEPIEYTHQGQYYTTGQNAMSLDEHEFDEFEFGFEANAVNFRATGDILITFDNPRDETQYIPVAASETPLTIGGDAALGATGVYVSPDPNATLPVDVDIIAY